MISCWYHMPVINCTLMPMWFYADWLYWKGKIIYFSQRTRLVAYPIHFKNSLKINFKLSWIPNKLKLLGLHFSVATLKTSMPLIKKLKTSGCIFHLKFNQELFSKLYLFKNYKSSICWSFLKIQYSFATFYCWRENCILAFRGQN